MNMTILVVGASGATGIRLVAELLNRGLNVKVIVRSFEKLPDSIKNNDRLSVITASVLELTDEDIQWADMVFISGMFIQLEAARQIIDRCKELNTKTVGGGPLFTAASDMFDDVDHLDFAILGAHPTAGVLAVDLDGG